MYLVQMNGLSNSPQHPLVATSEDGPQNAGGIKFGIHTLMRVMIKPRCLWRRRIAVEDDSTPENIASSNDNSRLQTLVKGYTNFGTDTYKFANNQLGDSKIIPYHALTFLG
ncbi:hypothetical protein BS47DRAFT_1454118 [Hydnum rufescens UP504]|uniref:Uncharacterized protein n=1 Tax=Hydnum rufescens UP504 TaxID=1448309 RepID=A0A9P6AC73_9AGAM|nr:hypothetical protein BS47DRAFT_1454118 [Hydnum rufescens UP504]